MSIEVNDEPDRRRYEATVDGKHAGLVSYRLHGSTIDLLHTEVEDDFEGEGVGSTLAREVLDDARARGLSVTPSCSFIRGYIERHPEYADLVPRG